MEKDIYVEIDCAQGNAPDRSWLEAIVRDVLSAEDVKPPYEVSIMLTNQERIRALNQQYRNIDAPTDVIAFYTEDPSLQGQRFVLPGDGVRHLGDVVVSLPQAIEQAQEQGHSASKELTLLVIHGVLHLLGYDHEISEDAAQMRQRETTILKELEGRHYN